MTISSAASTNAWLFQSGAFVLNSLYVAGRESVFMNQSLLSAGSYADYTINSNRSDNHAEHRNSVGREETLKSFDAKFPLQFKPSKVI